MLRSTYATFALTTLLLTRPHASAQTLAFSDQTQTAGVQVSMTPPILDLVEMLGGAAAGDFNRDGWQDLFVVSDASSPNWLFLNNGPDATGRVTFVNAAATWGVREVCRGGGAAVGDVNGDGWLDLFVTNMGPPTTVGELGSHRLFINQGDRFVEQGATLRVDATAVNSPDGMSAAFGDYDVDGDLDLAAAGWRPANGANRLFRNDGDMFTDVTTAVLPGAMEFAWGFSPRFADMDGDRQPELLWVSDFGTSRYLVWNGTAFEDRTALSGTGLDGNGMGAAVGDLNADGLLDWYVTSIHHADPADAEPPQRPGTGNMLYMNLGHHTFTETSAGAGVKDGGWGWGTVFVDFDHDTDLDIAETNGWGIDEFIGERSYLWLNRGDATFIESAVACSFDHTGQGRGMLNFDYDNDGDQDVVIVTNAGELRLLRNDLAGPATNWLRLFFDTSRDPALAPDGYGTRVVMRAGVGDVDGGITRYGYLAGGSNYLSQSELSVHFGLGAYAAADEVRIEWASGRVTTLTNVAANQTLTIAACPCDSDGDAGVDVFDLLTYLDDWFSAAPEAEFDGQSGINVFDLLAYLDCWFAGC